MTTAMPPSNAVLADFGIPAADHEELRNLHGAVSYTHLTLPTNREV